ncbi:hypothetical protein [Stutzerimonas stutzeri]|uniref:hypothetical protein n=1 Tax=Stutzerimonas stutzeri TaxID=316 RepID=UPI001C2E7BA5|nr:hypothetical protein [Stutzerimonas stutzeri]
MIAPAVVILLMIVGWSAAALAMLWGMLRVTRYHHKAGTNAPRNQGIGEATAKSGAKISLGTAINRAIAQ